MFQILLSIIVGISIGWSLHTYFTALTPKVKVIKENYEWTRADNYSRD